MGISSANHSGGILGHQYVSALHWLLGLRTFFVFLFPPRGSQGSSCNCKRAGGPNPACQWWSVEKGIAGIPAGIPVAGEKTKLPVIKEKGWLLFSSLLLFSLTYVVFPTFVGIRSTARLPRDSQDVRNQVLWVSSFFFLFSFTWVIQACPNRRRIF